MKKTIIFVVMVLIVTVSGYLIINNVVLKKNNNPNEEVPVEEEEEVIVPTLKIMDINSKTRPVAVMINNHYQARPYQSGLNDAYIVYEMIVEGGITRLMAIFKDQTTTRIGSVRSSRHYYLDYVLENDAIYVHFGYSPQAESDMNSLKISHIDGMSSGSAFFRDKNLKVAYEHTAFSSMQLINTAVSNKKFRNTSENSSLLKYSVKEIDMSSKDGALKANKVVINYSDESVPSFVYNSETKLYTRYYNNVKQVDYLSKEDMTSKNIIVYKVRNYYIDSSRQGLDNIGSGEGYFISNGYAVPITWKKEARGTKTVYKYLNGEEISVNDGNTYIQIMPTNMKLAITE